MLRSMLPKASSQNRRLSFDPSFGDEVFGPSVLQGANQQYCKNPKRLCLAIIVFAPRWVLVLTTLRHGLGTSTRTEEDSAQRCLRQRSK